MECIAKQDFSDEVLKPPWRVIGDWTFENGEAIPEGNSSLVCELGEPYRSIEIEFEVEVDDADTVGATIDRYKFEDEVTHKDDGIGTPLWAGIQELTDELGLPFYACHRHGCILPGEEWAALQGRMAVEASDSGMDGIILYENQEAMTLAEKPGVFEVTQPGIVDVIESLQR